MADITIICPHCHAASQVSEYAASPVPCPFCGRLVDKPGHCRPDDLKVKPEPVGGPLNQPPGAGAVGAVAVHAADLRESAVQRVRGPRSFRLLERILAWLVFLVATGVLIGWQYAGRRDAELLNTYYAVRWLPLGAIWVAVIIAAFADSKLQGFLCLGIPPYLLYFALNRMDSSMLRALFFAALLTLLAEYYFLPHGLTVLNLVQQQIAHWVQLGHDWIKSLGREAM